MEYYWKKKHFILYLKLLLFIVLFKQIGVLNLIINHIYCCLILEKYKIFKI